MPEGKHYRRGHWVNNSPRGAKSSSKWIGFAVVAVLGWGLLHGGFSTTTDTNSTPTPTPTVSQPAAR
ncbi:hypothetical protein QMK19_35540 [Streptomyces sp. H10-C2]|uniref:hypothetical protein n=1 Tax=unclassified Streptomyces TaxID=2593676 RepID=UPI0024B8DCC5|nr:MULTISPECIES: hypothetical protein [unclassified Streptomyces]MDJ0347432.1 hypothetical protein [Streptomyces sp. PH10-H1]MDJ0374797.1 hypothetical protein [Streptomyces sp. H10-C2]